MSLGLMDPAFVGGLGGAAYDTDAQTYITAVETADGQSLEVGVKDAINAFVVGCKADGIWSAIKASCILAGARTLAGALVPLVGPAPTSVGFVDGDYNRKTGLKGAYPSSKYLNSGLFDNSVATNSFHLAVYVTAGASIDVAMHIGGSGNDIYRNAGNGLTFRNRDATLTIANKGSSTGFIGHSRGAASSFTARLESTNYSGGAVVTLPTNAAIFVFARGSGSLLPTDARQAFYSIGENLNLTPLDSRVTTLVNAISAAIP